MKLNLTSAPHIRSNTSTSRIMLDVALALLPALAVGIFKFGPRAILVTIVSILASVATEAVYCIVTGKKITVFDGSALVTGLLLAMTLPHTAKLWVVVIGAVFAILTKALSGGIGKNIFNPALLARAFLVIIAPVEVTKYVSVDAVSSSTPLHQMVMPSLPKESILDMFLGNCSGSIGEISALALIIGGAYLVIRKIISLRIPLSYLATVAIITLVFHKTDAPIEWMLYSLFSGGLMLGAIFMATDYTTSPVTHSGQIAYGIGCGLLTVFLRYNSLFPEGITYAVLIMNSLVWIIERFSAPVRFGTKKGGRKE